MKYNIVDVLNMLGTWFSGFGAFSAVLYAINVNRPRLNARVINGKHNHDDNYVVEVCNLKTISAQISHVRLVQHKTLGVKKSNPSVFSRHSILSNVHKRQSDYLNIDVLPGACCLFDISAKSLLDAYCDFCDIRNPAGMKKMVRARIAIYLRGGAICYADLPDTIYQEMKNVLFMESQRLIQVYGSDIHTVFYKTVLDEYELAVKRHSYVSLPKGVCENKS